MKLINSILPKKNKPASDAKKVRDSLSLADVTPFATEFDLAHLDVIHWAPVWMTRAERLLIFTLTFTLRPTRYLEIGTLHGGSALMVNAAMNSLNSNGKLVCIDPVPQIAPEHWEILKSRTTLITGYSPDALPEAEAKAGGKFDLVLIDGDHTAKGLLRDAEGVLPHVADNAYLLFHDSFFPEIATALDDFAANHSDILIDFGDMTREITTQKNEAGQSTTWGGLRMMQLRRQAKS
jgi:predicted O-methyltransferase YrrM